MPLPLSHTPASSSFYGCNCSTYRHVLGYLCDALIITVTQKQFCVELGVLAGASAIDSCCLSRRLTHSNHSSVLTVMAARRLSVALALASVVLLATVLPHHSVHAGACVALGDCNSHGVCTSSNKTCTCYDGWGSDSDVSLYKAADCSKRTSGLRS